MIRPLSLAATIALTSPAVAATETGAFAVRIPITAVAGASLQRLQLPAAALVHLREPDYADLRVLDADGRPQAIALLDARTPSPTRRLFRLEPLPILGAPGSLTVTGITLRVDPAGTSRVVRVDGSVRPPTGLAVLLGVLLDTQSIKGRPSTLTLDVDVPPQQPVTFAIEGSADLRNWVPLADTVVYRVPGQSTRAVLPLTHDQPANRYLRVTWRAATPLLAPVLVSGATLTTSSTAAMSPIVATLTGAMLADPHDLRLTLPFATPVAAIRVVPPGNGLLPLRILGRPDDERPWQLIGEGTAYRLASPTGVRNGAAVPLPRSFRQIQLEADPRTPGFSAVPQVELAFEPREIAMLLTGRAPYTLVAGRRGVVSAFLPVSAILASASNDDPALLPIASVREAPTVVASDDPSTSDGWRTRILWTVLLVGTLSLGALAWLAGRKPASKEGRH